MSKTQPNSLSDTASNNPWFSVSMGLLGAIVGSAVTMLLISGGVINLGSGSGAPAPKPVVADDPAPTPRPTPQAGEVRPYDPEIDYVRGDPDAVITLFEWSDAECPFCKRHHATPQAIIDNPKYDGKVNWVYRHFPLAFHPNAQKTAEAQECAGFIGGNDAFWEYTDIVFEKGASIPSLESYAAEMGLDATAFKDCLDSDKFAQKVKDSMAEGSKAGVTGTPGNIVYNNKTEEAQLISGAQPVSVFESAIDNLM